MDDEARDPLIAFLYELMAEHLPPQRVAWIVRNANEGVAFKIPELHGLAARLAWDLAGPDPVDAEVGEAPEEEEGPALVQYIVGASGGRLLVGTPDGELAHADFTPEMKAFLDLFDDRISRLPTFVEAVNMAAEAGREANEDTARHVAQSARELRELRDADGGALDRKAGDGNG